MTDIPEGRITAGKLQSDELQIHLGEPAAVAIANTPTHIETKIVNPKQNRPQMILWWIMAIILLLTVLNLFSTIITYCKPIVFENVTRIYLPCLLFFNPQ